VPFTATLRSSNDVAARPPRTPPGQTERHELSCVALALLLLAGSAATQATGAQQRARPDTTRQTQDTTAALDSLRTRLARAEAAIALLREQLAEESETAVRTNSRLRLELSAQVLTNAFATLGRVNNVDVPQTVLPPPGANATPATNDALGFTLRQTRVGAAVSVADVLGGTFAGDLDFDLYGGVQDGPGDRRLFPEPRLRTARALLIWSRTELMVGSETPLISDLNPMSLAAVGIPEFSAAGNLWNWLAQVRITRELAAVGRGSRAVRLAIQGAIVAPYANTIAAGEPDAVDAAERSRRPAIEARLRGQWGGEGRDRHRVTTGTVMIGDRGGEIGVGVHRGWVATAPRTLEDSRAVSVDAQIVPVRGVELRGEAYTGQVLRGLGGGGIAQNFGPLGAPVRDVAGWAQLNVQPHPVLITGVGCGVDLVDSDANPTRLQNTVCAAHVAWRPRQPLVIGLEYRQLGTRLVSGTFGARHVNVVLGFEL
jgi:hypothetical protein